MWLRVRQDPPAFIDVTKPVAIAPVSQWQTSGETYPRSVNLVGATTSEPSPDCGGLGVPASPWPPAISSASATRPLNRSGQRHAAAKQTA